MARDPARLAEAGDMAHGLRHDAEEREVAEFEQLCILREVAQPALGIGFASCQRFGVADDRHAPLSLDARIVLVVRDQADARVIQEIFRVFRQPGDEQQHAAVMVGQVRRDRTERVAVEALR